MGSWDLWNTGYIAKDELPKACKIVYRKKYICPTCKKEFEGKNTNWAYKYSGKKYCSYTCMRKVEKGEIKNDI